MDSTETRFISKCEEDTERIAADFAKMLKSGDFIAFFGDLGSGKTAFIRGVASVLCPAAHVSSPTYAIVNEYRGELPLFHFDLYRITDDDSLYATGFYDYFDRRGVIAAEWCENVPYALPDKRYDIVFTKTGECEREIVIKKNDSSQLLV